MFNIINSQFFTWGITALKFLMLQYLSKQIQFLVLSLKKLKRNPTTTTSQKRKFLTEQFFMIKKKQERESQQGNLIGQSSLEQLKKNPLGPLVIFRFNSGNFTIPVI